VDTHTDCDRLPNEIMRCYRRLKGLTQEQAAEMLDVSQQQYQKYERGETNFSVAMLKKICRVLEMPPEKFFSNNNGDLINKIVNDLMKYRDVIRILNENPELSELIKFYGNGSARLKNINLKKLLRRITLINNGNRKLVVSMITPAHLLISDEKGVRNFKKGVG